MRQKNGILSAALLSLGFVIAAFVLAGAFVRGRTTDETIHVIGSARKPIRSDFIIWSGNVTQTAPTIAQAYGALTDNMAKVRSYLVAKGIPAEEIVPAAITTKTLFARVKSDNSDNSNSSDDSLYRPVVGYQLSQEIEVRSASVDRVDAISRQSTELISKGIPFQSDPPQYLYTKLSDVKVSVQAEAAQDAHARAEQIALRSGCHLGAVRHARMSAPVITPLYSSAVSDGGIDDTSALDKRITAVVTVEYAIR